MKNKSRVFFWSLYDFGNSSYAVIIVAFVFAVYFTKVVCSGSSEGDLLWSIGINISMILSAVLNPVCGAIADKRNNKKLFLIFFTLLAVIPTALLYFSAEGRIMYSLILFIISNIGFQTGLTFYDAFIYDITEENYYNKVSSIGYAVGYIGSMVSVFLVFPFENNYNLLFAVTALFYLVFSLPLFLFVSEKKKIVAKKINYISYGFKKVYETLIHINKYKNLRNYLISFFLYIDAVNTIIFFSGIYAAKSLNFSTFDLAVFFIIVQITAMIGSLIFGYLGDYLGVLRSIKLTLIFWILIIAAIFFFVNETSSFSIGGYDIHLFFIIGGFAGTFLGSTQSLSRALMAKLTPEEIKTEFFGFYSLFDKTSTLLGPLTFGLVSWITGSQKVAVVSVGFFFIAGIYALKFVKEKKQEI